MPDSQTGHQAHLSLSRRTSPRTKPTPCPPDEDIENLTDDEVDRTGALYNNLSGLYLYNGHFQGIFSRLGPFPTISKDLKGITAATIRVRG